MLKLTKKADYGLMALKYLAEHPEKPALSAKDVADAYGIPAQLLAKILQLLTKNGLAAFARRHEWRLCAGPGCARDFGLRSDSRHRRAVFHYLLHQGRKELRADAELHHQRAVGAGERHHCRSSEEHQYSGSGGARTARGASARGAGVGCIDVVTKVFPPRCGAEHDEDGEPV